MTRAPGRLSKPLGVGHALSMLVGVAACLATPAAAAPITLQDALQRASEAAPQLAAAIAGVTAATGRARQAGFAPNPEASLVAEDIGGSGAYTAFDQSEVTLSVGQRFELGGKRRARRSAAEAEIETARLRVEVARADLEQDVRQRFFEALAWRSRVELASSLAQSAAELARVTAILVDAGREPPLRALRAKTASQEAASRVDAARAEYASAQRALSALWSAPEESPDPIQADLAVSDAPIDPAAGLDVRVAEAELNAARAGVDRERALATPDVTVSVGVRRLNDTHDTALVVGASAPIPIRDRNQGSIAAARADALGAEARRNLALSEAVRRARDAHATLVTATARVALLEQATTPQAAEALRLAREGYAAGKFSLLDVLDAQTALAAAQSDLIDARLARAKAAAALLRAAAR